MLTSSRAPLVCRLLSTVTLCFALLAPKAARASLGFQPVNPDELKMTSEPLAPGAPAIILYRQVDRDDDRYDAHEDDYLRIKILTEEGRKEANIEIVLWTGFETVSNIHARTIKPDGSIVDFNGQIFDESVVKGRGGEYVAKTFTLPDVQVGGIIEYYYKINFVEGFVFDSRWILSEALFTRDARFSLKQFEGPGMHLRWTWQTPVGSEPKVGAHGIVGMEAHNIPAFQEEEYMPPENELKARVDFVYESDLPLSDPDKYWQRLGKQRNEALEGFVDKRKPMADAVSQIISPADDPETKLRKIYARVQQMRNKSFEESKTRQEEKRAKEKTETNVEQVWKNGYGNGTQLTWLFLALVRAAGFEAYGCWVADRQHYFFHPQMMKGSELDTNVVLVKLNGKDMYFDPGEEFAPFGMLEWSETGVVGLQLDKNGGKWILTPLPHAPESQLRREAKLKLSEDGDLVGSVTITFTGLEAMYRRQNQLHGDVAARKLYLEEIIKGQIPVAAEVELTNSPDWSGSEAPLVAVLTVKIPAWTSAAGKRVMMPVGLFTEQEKHIFEHANRVHAIYFAYPYEKLDDVTIELPQGWKIDGMPQPKLQDAKVLLYDLKVENKENTVHITRKLDLDVMYLQPKVYPALREFFQLLRTADEQQVLLQPAATSALR